MRRRCMPWRIDPERRRNAHRWLLDDLRSMRKDMLGGWIVQRTRVEIAEGPTSPCRSTSHSRGGTCKGIGRRHQC